MRADTLAVTVFLLALVACQSDVSDTSGPPTLPPVDTTKPPTTVQRATITVTVNIDAEDAAIAQQAQVSPTTAIVRLLRVGSAEPERVRVADASSVARFDSLLEGRYAVSVARALTDEDLSRLEPSQREARFFAGGAQVNLVPPSPISATVSLVASRRGSLVISELYGYTPGPPWHCRISIRLDCTQRPLHHTHQHAECAWLRMACRQPVACRMFA